MSDHKPLTDADRDAARLHVIGSLAKQLVSVRAELAVLRKAVTDDGAWYEEWCEHVRSTCSDPHHDPRWCSTCANRIDGGEMYAAWLRERVNLEISDTIYPNAAKRLAEIAALCDEAGKPENRCATPDIFRQIAKLAKGE